MSAVMEESVGVWPLLFKFRPGASLSDPDDFFDFCQDNAPWNFERTAKGDLIVTMPTGGVTGARNAYLNYQLVAWALADGNGQVCDSNTGFLLPDGAMRAPDAAWIRKDRLAALTAEEKKKFLPLVPDFIIELRSESDRLSDLKDKMIEWREAGVRLGVLLDCTSRTAWLYRPDAEVREIPEATTLVCDPELPGFVLDTAALFDLEI
jgi:Uma2 family endonuclease